MSHCKQCAREKSKAYYEANTERIKQVNRERAARRRAKHPDYERWLKIKKKYGITKDDYDALWEKQDGRCAICAVDLATVKACVDHCHQSSEVRGLLCNTCNQGLGYFADDPGRLLAAVAYLGG